MTMTVRKTRWLTQVAALATLLLAAPSWAQLAEDEPEKPEKLEKDVRERLWLDLEATGVAASGRSVDANEDEDRSGGLFRARLGWDRDVDVNHFDLSFSSAYYAYTDGDRSYRWSNSLFAAYGRDISDTVQISLRARGATRLSTLESREADEARLQGRIAYQEGNHRLRVTGGWRWRDYQDRDGAHGDGPMAEVEYRYRLGRGTYILTEATYEEIDSNEDRLTYDRVTLYGGGRIRMSHDLDLDLGLKWRDWENSYRLIGTESRHASSIAPEAELSYEFDDDWSVTAGGTVIWRNSNDPDYERTVYRGFLTLEKQFWLDR